MTDFALNLRSTPRVPFWILWVVLAAIVVFILLGVMVLRFGPSAGVELTAGLACEARAGDDW